MRLFISGAAAVDPQVSKDFRNFGILTTRDVPYGMRSDRSTEQKLRL